MEVQPNGVNVAHKNEDFLISNQQENMKSETHEDESESPPRKTVEIERKFIIPDDCEEKLLMIGCRFVSQEEFTDHYYDTEDYQLTLGDRWLRNRSGRWQMKYPLPELPHGLSSRYCETETESEILDLLSKFTSRTADSLQDFVRSSCQPIVVLRTLRKSYSCDNVTIVLDSTDCGFRIGEIEVVVREGESLVDGLQAVDDLAGKLGATHAKEGKIRYYLRTRQPHIYNLLLSRAVFNPPASDGTQPT